MNEMNLTGRKPLTNEELERFIASARLKKEQTCKRNFSKKITPEQGLYIKYRLKCTGVTGADIAFEVGCTNQAVQSVLSGKSHSQRIERAVAIRLGYKSWNDMVTELREKAA